jgi:hypothetical protein
VTTATVIDAPLLVLDLGLHIINGIRGLDLEGDRLSGESLYKDLHNWKFVGVGAVVERWSWWWLGEEALELVGALLSRL